MRRSVQIGIIIVVICVIAIVVVGVALNNSDNSNDNNTTTDDNYNNTENDENESTNTTQNGKVLVNNTKVKYNSYGTYNITADITPESTYDYLEMNVEFYDANDNLLDKGLAWNINKPTKDQLIKASGSLYLQSSSKPAYAKVYVSDSASGDTSNPLYKETVNITS